MKTEGKLTTKISFPAIVQDVAVEGMELIKGQLQTLLITGQSNTKPLTSFRTNSSKAKVWKSIKWNV